MDLDLRLMFIEHQSTSGAKIWPAPALHKSSTALLLPYGNYGASRISPTAKRIITSVGTGIRFCEGCKTISFLQSGC